jgi:hypothetical protein
MKVTTYGNFLHCHITSDGEIQVSIAAPCDVRNVQMNVYEAEGFAMELLRLVHRQKDRNERQEKEMCAMAEAGAQAFNSVGYTPRD